MIKPLKLGEFPDSEFEVSGRTMTELLEDTLHFSITLYEGPAFYNVDRFSAEIHVVYSTPMKDLDANCAHADDWTFDNVFLFVGNMATTIGYGHIVPESQHGKLMCIICRFKNHATYDMQHIVYNQDHFSHISIYRLKPDLNLKSCDDFTSYLCRIVEIHFRLHQ